jgi:hypothetical protein
MKLVTVVTVLCVMELLGRQGSQFVCLLYLRQLSERTGFLWGKERVI